MLDFEQKLTILASYPQLTRKDVSLGRVNFHYEDSVHEKKTVAYHLHPNGNGYIYTGMITDVVSDAKGMTNVRECTEDEFRSLITRSIASLSGSGHKNEEPSLQTERSWGHGRKPAGEEDWIGPNDARLTVIREQELWYIYAGSNIEMAFETYQEAVQYLEEEQFHRA